MTYELMNPIVRAELAKEARLIEARRRIGLFPSAASAWLAVVERIFEEGKPVAARGRSTREVVPGQVRFDMRYPFPHPRRAASRRFLAGEAWWILSGRDDVASIARFNRRIADYSDNGATFFGAYGPKVAGQLDSAVGALCRDPGSRQAVVNVWRENPPTTRDVPCTLSLQFLIRGAQELATDPAAIDAGGERLVPRLHLVATMRSSDAWLGVPYDFFNFSMIALAVAIEVRRYAPASLADLGLGTMSWTAGSSHLYNDDEARARAALRGEEHDGIRSRASTYPAATPAGFQTCEDLASFLLAAAKENRLPDWAGR
jgi:thymidylate synthase